MSRTSHRLLECCEMDNKVHLPRNVNSVYRPKRRTPLESYMRRLSLQYVHPDETLLDKQIRAKIYTISLLYKPNYKHQRSIKLTNFGKTDLSKNSQSSKLEQEKKRFFYSVASLIVSILAAIIICNIIKGEIHNHEKITMQPINNYISVFKNVKVYYYQGSFILNNDPTINKVISKATKNMSLIIILFSNYEVTMDSLALIDASKDALNAKNFMLNPENVGNDTGVIVDTLKEQVPMKNVDIIHNTKAVIILHSFCNRINPLTEETVYILTLQIDNYQLSEGKLTLVKKHIYHKLSNSIDRDTLMTFIMCITEWMIMPLQSESQLKYC